MYSLEEVRNVDPEIAQAIVDEQDRQNSHIELIASENWVSKAVMAAMGSPLTNKYAEGYPGKRYYGGCDCVDVVERLAIQPSPLEMISVSFQDGGVDVCIGGEFVFYEHISTVSEHEIVYQYNDKRPDWYEAVIQEGRDGEYTEVYEIIYQDGQRTARQLIDVVDTEPVSTVIEKGTMENFANNDDAVSAINVNEDGSGVITLENGETVTFSSTRTMRGTAYTTGGSVGTRTASGTTVRVGVVAVDRSVLPLGTKVYVMSNDGMYVYGFAVAEDTGVRGNTIDLYMDTNRECIQFGVRECTVYILD